MPDARDDYLDLHFPKAGINVMCPFGRQPNSAVGAKQEYARSTPEGVNVRGYDPAQDRFRGGSRGGLSKRDGFMSQRVNGVLWVVQEVNSVVVVSAEATSNLLVDLAGYYRLEDNLLDSSGHDRNLQNFAASYTASGKINHAIQAGAGRRHPLGGVTDNAVSLAAWFFCVAATGDGGGTGFGRGSEVGDALRLAYRANGANGKIVVRNRTGVDVLDSGFVYTFGTWVHACYTYDGTTVVLYVNGASVGSAAYSLTDPGWSALTFSIDATGADFASYLDEVAVYSRPLAASELVQLYNAGTGFDPTGENMQLSQSGRSVKLVAVSQGVVKFADIGDSAWTTATNNTGETPPLNYNGVMQSAENNQKLYFADGINYVYFDPETESVELWVASAGTLPIDSDSNTPRLITTWRGRTVLSGLLKDPQNIFMSAVGDPTDFDYAPLSPSPTQAVALNLSPLGYIGDAVTALIAYSDDVLVVGGDHTIWKISGDPMNGGQIDRISDAIGIAYGQAWCKDPYGTIYFLSNRTGVFALVPGQLPVRISQAVETLLRQIDTGRNVLRMQWDDEAQGFWLFVTWVDEPRETTHFFFDQRSGAWWKVEFGNTLLNPLCCCTFDGNEPGDRVSLVGCWDGYVRQIDPEAEDDDGTPIASEVWIGPLVTKDFDDIMLKDLQAVLGESSGDVDWSVYSAATAELALTSEPVTGGTWEAGRNLTDMVRSSDHAHFVKLSSTNRWAMEAIRARITTLGKVRRRGH